MVYWPWLSGHLKLTDNKVLSTQKWQQQGNVYYRIDENVLALELFPLNTLGMIFMNNVLLFVLFIAFCI